MADRSENTRPTKRARLLEPDGFATSKRVQKAFPVNQFVSAFDETLQNDAETIRSKKLESLEKRATTWRNPKTTVERPQNGQPSRRPLHSLMPPPRPPLSVPPETGSSSRKHARPLTSLISSIPQSQASAMTSFTKPLPNLIPPPLSGPATPKSTKGLRPLKPPSFPLNPSRPDPSKMKTLSTTNAAIATNPFTEQGSLNLLAMVAKTAAANYVKPLECEIRRGLLQSPEKASRNKKKQQKYLPGGLADNAKLVLSRSAMSLALWEKEIQSHAKRRVIPEVSLRVLSVVFETPPRSQPRQLASRSPVTAIVRTKVEASKIDKVISGGELFVMLRLDPPTDDPPRSVKEGSCVGIWRPWFTVPLPSEIQGVSTAIGGKKLLMCSRFLIPK